jgi:putative ABC transport system permease protein
MNVARNAALSCEILAGHKLRTFLSVTGVVVGVAAVVLVVSAGRGSEKRILDRIRDMGTDLIVVNAGQTRIVAGRERQMATVTTLVPQDAEAIVKKCPSVARAAPLAGKKLAAKFEGETTNTNVVGMTPDGFQIRNMDIASGRFFSELESRGRRRVAVLGPTVVKNLFGNADAVGRRLRIGRVPFEVVGVTRPKGVDVSGTDQDDLIIVPLGTAMRRLLNLTHVKAIYVQARGARSLVRAEREIRQVLRKRHRLRDKPDDFTIRNQATLLVTERETSRSLTLLIGSVAAISLLVGGVGILAVMLMSIRERTKEIGLRRALGARRQDIRNQFLIESSILAGGGGALGVILGLAASFAAPGLGYWDRVIPWSAAAIGFVFSVSLGIVFGLYPATHAASLQPVAALRAE